MNKAIIVLSFVFGLCCGIALAHINDHRGVDPIAVDFCFLTKNQWLFSGRKINTTANIEQLEHGALLVSPGCASEEGLTFGSTSESNSQLEEVGTKLHDHILAQIPITFVGKVNRQSAAKRWFISVKRFFGMKVTYDPDVTIEHISLSGNVIDSDSEDGSRSTRGPKRS